MSLSDMAGAERDWSPPPWEGEKDAIKVPNHYTHSRVEVIDAIEAWGLGYHLGNVVKYVARADHKGNALQDLKKARQYLSREIARREGREGEWE